MNKEFIPGLELSELFFKKAVKPLIDKNYPNLQYTAALLGSGSEVLGFDDIVSTDHHWGPRLQIFLKAIDYNTKRDSLDILFQDHLPYSFKGYPTNWSKPNKEDPDDAVTQIPRFIDKGKINHRIDILTVESFVKTHFGVDHLPATDFDWLILSDQLLLEFVSGKIFYDSLGQLKETRKKLAYFPKNVWLYKLIAQWSRIMEERAFVGRTAQVGDLIGSKLVLTKIIGYLMELSFILNKKYIPYPKWFGTAFNTLSISKKLNPIFNAMLNSGNWKKQELLLCDAYLLLLKEQNELHLTSPIELSPEPYYSRSQTVINIRIIIDELAKNLKEPLKSIKEPLGTISQITNNVKILSHPLTAQKMNHFFEKI